MMTMSRAAFLTTRHGVTLSAKPTGGEDRRTLETITIMTGRRARDGDVVEPMGMDVSAYLRNPVVLWAHDALGAGPSGGLPIARTISLEPGPDGITATFEWLEGDAFAQRVRHAWEQGFVNAASIGWITREWSPLRDGRSAGDGASAPTGAGRRHTKTELVEWSLVPVPADVGATRRGYADTLRGLGLAPAGEGNPLQLPPEKGEGRKEDLVREELAAAARGLREAVAGHYHKERTVHA